jgi:hypothetical protein
VVRRRHEVRISSPFSLLDFSLFLVSLRSPFCAFSLRSLPSIFFSSSSPLFSCTYAPCSGRVEGALYQDSTITALLQLFATANTQTSLTPILHAFNRLLSASTKLNHALVSKGLVSKLLEKLRISQLPAETRIDLLKFLKMLFESALAKKEFVSRNALTAALEPLSKDKAVLVQELASQLTAQFGKL